MAKNNQLEKKAKEVILKQMEELSEIDTETVMELIRPHFSADYQKLANQALRRAANSLMRSYKDDKGIRTIFNYKNDGTSKYVNIETTQDLKALKEVESQLNKKYIGLNASKKKVNRRKQQLSGQITIDDIMNE